MVAAAYFTEGDVRSACKHAAVRTHPDKGGDIARFVTATKPFEAVFSELASLVTACNVVQAPVWGLAARCVAW